MKTIYFVLKTFPRKIFKKYDKSFDNCERVFEEEEEKNDVNISKHAYNPIIRNDD